MRNAMQQLGRVFVIAMTSALVCPAAVRGVGTDPGDSAMAERLADAARLTLANRYLTPAHWKMAGALLQGAVKLQPNEPRYSRLWADAMLQAREPETALKALNAYVRVEPDDKPALIQLLDLHANAFETVDKRLDYLRDWVDDTRLAEEVRSHTAFLAYLAYTERSQLPQAKNMLDQALKLNPLSMEALRVRFDQLAVNGTPYERISTLLAILKSNPNQVQYVSRLSQELSNVGLSQAALQFYGIGFTLATKQGSAIPREFAMAYAMELMVHNPPQYVPAKQLVDQLSVSSPADYTTLVLRLFLERATDQKEPAAKTIQQMNNVLLNSVQTYRQKLGDKSATTRPVDSSTAIEWGSFDGDVKPLKELQGADAEKTRAGYISTLTEIAWVQTYFLESPANATPAISALRQLLPENNPSIARLEGWGFLVKGEKDQARVKLSAVKDKDLLAEVGLVRLMNTEASKAEGDQLLARNPVGLLAVLIVDALKDRKVVLAPVTAVSGPIMEALNKFPGEWLAILDQPQKFYVLKAEPLKLAHAFGEPILVRVSIQNISEYPITLGAEGILHQDLWFDADFRGVLQQSIPGAAYDRIGHEIVIKPRSTISQLIRVDQGPIAQTLNSSPFPALQLVLKVRTNPSTTSPNGVGPAGQIVTASKFVERNGFALSAPSIAKLTTAMQQGGPAEKIAKIDLAASAALILSQQQGSEDIKRVAMQLVTLLKAAAHDPVPVVASWGGATIARLSTPTERPEAVKLLMNDPLWVSRVLGLYSMGPLSLQLQQSVAKQAIAGDTDPIVVAYAKALDELLDLMIANAAAHPATTQATTTPVAPSSPGATLVPPTPGPNAIEKLPGAQPSPFNPGAPPAPSTKPSASDLVIPSLPIALPPSSQPSSQPAGK